MKKFILSIITALLMASPATAADWCAHANNKGCWLMTDSGNENDRSTNGETLTETSGTIPTSTTNKFNETSKDFEAGDTEYLEHADGGSTEINGANAQLTMVMWLNMESQPTSTNLMWPMAKYNSTGNQRQYGLVIDSANSDFMGCNISDAGTAFVDADSSTVSDTATWVHWACVSNDVDIRLYKNGVLEADVQAHSAGIFNSSAAFRIGASANSTPGYLDSLVDDAGIFNTGLDATDVNNIMVYGLKGPTTLQAATLQGATLN